MLEHRIITQDLTALENFPGHVLRQEHLPTGSVDSWFQQEVRHTVGQTLTQRTVYTDQCMYGAAMQEKMWPATFSGEES